MASIFDLFQTHETTISYVDDFSKIPVEFTLDVTSAIDTSISAKVTDFPIEGKANITDHVQPGPRMLTLSGLISESPSQQLLVLAQALAAGSANQATQAAGGSGLAGTFAAAAAAAAVGAAGSLLGGGGGGENMSALLQVRAEVDQDYPKRAMKGLMFMLEAGQRFTVRTYMTDDLYTDMIMTSLSFKNDAQNGESLPFTLACKQIKTVSAFGKLPLEVQMKAPAGSSAATAVSKGGKSPAPPKTPTGGAGGDKGSSLAKKLRGA